ncbi:NACHT domain-containing protein [Actinomadura sp. KC216]|uniref:NACHT domain-containing protein n=1 Tax=Actinomadura sp. KC216 TaxID=2530370 RepID=UPI0010439690|nr:NACHT domain-containing protein [Actinomadura sp. KC216]TDB88223.1 NACHT domain-containing protein [Actinomadura sp. KC216]
MGRANVRVLVAAGAAAVVACGVATNQVLDDGKLSWHWAYLAFGFAVLASVFSLQVAQGPQPSARGRLLPIGGERRAYLRQLRASVVDMETIGVVTQGESVLHMRQIYVHVRLRPWGGQAAYDDAGIGLLPPEEPDEHRTLRSFLGDGRVFAVIGASGSGKTTLVRHTALAMCDQRRVNWRRRQLPVLLYLRDHVDLILQEEQPRLAEVATSAGWLEGRISADWLAKRMDRGRCLVLLDGLDEIADEGDRKRVVAWTRRQIERYPSAAFVVTSRPHGYQANPIPNADVLQVQRFTADQIGQFLHHWYYAVECRARGRTGKHVRRLAAREADDLLGKLQSIPAVYELAANPLLLTMIVNVHRYRSALPRSRAALYAEMCDVLIHRRQEAKDLTDATGLDGPRKERVMSHLALHMMREQFRDIPVDSARNAIRRPLRKVTDGDRITPEVFLTEIRKSGLLMQREHSGFGFAHLTLQEYLAAARIQERPGDYLHLLTEGVNDPWWRETTLLWAACGDATPVIEACLASGTIHALTLAFDCADEALEVSPETRDRLNRLLTSPSAPDLDDETTLQRHRLLAAVLASRVLREVVWLGATAVTSRPVTRKLYNLFALHEQASGRHVPAVAADDEPATGVWANDAKRFVTWLNTLFDDGTACRLPTPSELAHPDASVLSALTAHTIWTGEGQRAFLHRSGRVPWPYTPTRHRIAKCPTEVVQHLRSTLQLAQVSATDPDPRHLLGYLAAFAELFTAHGSDQPDLEAVLAFDRARELAGTFDLALRLAIDLRPAHDRAWTDALGVVYALDSVLALDLRLVRDRTRERDLAPDLVHKLDRAGALLREPNDPHRLNATRTLIGTLIDELTEASRLYGCLTAEVDRARDRARSRARHIDDNDHGTLVVLRHALGQDGDYARDLSGDRSARTDALALAHAHALAVVRNAEDGTGPAVDMARRETLDRSRALAQDIARAATREIARTIAQEFARDYGPRFREALATTVLASSVLLSSWPTAVLGPRTIDGRAQPAFECFLAETLDRAAVGRTSTGEDPYRAIHEVAAAVRHAWPPLPAEILALVSSVHDLVGPVLDRTAPADRRVLTVASAGLLAAMVPLLSHAGRFQGIVDRLAQALGSLLVLADRESGPSPNEAILLVRV